MTETKAREVLVLRDGLLATELSPPSALESGGQLDELLSPGRILLPPLVVGHTASVAQQRDVPVLAGTSAAVACLESTDATFHLIIGAGKVLAVVALH